MELEAYKKGADEILTLTANSMKGADGAVRPQSLMCALGAVAGYSCQRDVRKAYVFGKGIDEDKVFRIIFDKQGEKYYFGELLDNLLVSDKYSLWGFIGGALKHIGVKLIDVEDILRYVSFTAGKEAFGKVRSCDTGETPNEYLSTFWKPLCNIAKKYCQADDFHMLFGLALQKAIMNCSGSYNPSECARISLESGIFCARSELKIRN